MSTRDDGAWELRSRRLSVLREREDRLVERVLAAGRVGRAGAHVARRRLVEVVAKPELVRFLVERRPLCGAVAGATAGAVVGVGAPGRTRHDLVAHLSALKRLGVASVVDGIVVPRVEAVLLEDRRPELRDPGIRGLVQEAVERRALAERGHLRRVDHY